MTLLHYFLVILPNLAGYLAKCGIIEFFPMEPVSFLGDFTNKIIDRRKKKLEVGYFIKNLFNQFSNKLLNN